MLIFVLFQAIKMVGDYVSIIHYHMFATNSFCNEVWNYILFQRQKNDHLLKKQEQFKLCNKLIPYNLSWKNYMIEGKVQVRCAAYLIENM
jgi:hypothetical protein